jgi:hypothetical protein
MRWKNVFCNGLTLLEMRGSGKVQRHTISVYIGGTIRNNSKKGKKGKREKGKKGKRVFHQSRVCSRFNCSIEFKGVFKGASLNHCHGGHRRVPTGKL